MAQRTDALERAIGSLRHQGRRARPCTGLGNRRMLDLSMPKLMEDLAARRRPICRVLVIRCRQLQETERHAGARCGDQLLRDLGQLIRSTVRATDMSFRMGGDEFVILMPGADEVAATTLSDRLVALVDMYAKPLGVQPRPGLSIGLSRMLAIPDVTSESLLKAADEGLISD